MRETSPAIDRLPSGRLGNVRLEAFEDGAGAILPQILRLRSIVLGRRVSLSSDLVGWGDDRDAGALHWAVFHEAELVAAARMTLHESLNGLAEAAAVGVVNLPVAVMSLCVVAPSYAGFGFDAALDAARLERARQLRLPSVITLAESRARRGALEVLGFRAIGRGPVRRRALLLELAR